MSAPGNASGGRPPEPRVLLRGVEPRDVEAFFDHQRDAEANRIAAFPPRARAAHEAHWSRILADRTVVARTVLVDGEVAGNVVSFEQAGRRLVGYWIGREHWGRGVATRALASFLALVPARPLHAIVAAHNPGSIRVLEKCGFVLVERLPPAEGPEDVEELLFALEGGGGRAQHPHPSDSRRS